MVTICTDAEKYFIVKGEPEEIVRFLAKEEDAEVAVAEVSRSDMKELFPELFPEG